MKRPGVWESDQGASYHRDNLASLYRPPYHLMLHGSFEKVHVHAWLYGPRVFSWLCIAIYVQDLYTEVVGIMDFVPFLLPYSLQVISNVGLKMTIYLIYLFIFFLVILSWMLYFTLFLKYITWLAFGYQRKKGQ